jgi:hypothetical protein
MTVYVDKVEIPATVGRHTSVWCHLVADTSEELEAFARRLRLQPSWIQHKGTWSEHYDLTAGKRRQAVALGAVELSIMEAGARLRARQAEMGPRRIAPRNV